MSSHSSGSLPGRQTWNASFSTGTIDYCGKLSYQLPTCLPTWLVSVAAFAPALVTPCSACSASAQVCFASPHLRPPLTNARVRSRWFGFHILANRNLHGAPSPQFFVNFSRLMFGSLLGLLEPKRAPLDSRMGSSQERIHGHSLGLSPLSPPLAFEGEI